MSYLLSSMHRLHQPVDQDGGGWCDGVRGAPCRRTASCLPWGGFRGMQVPRHCRGLPGPTTEGQQCDLYAALRIRIRIRRICTVCFWASWIRIRIRGSAMWPGYLDTYAASPTLYLYLYRRSAKWTASPMGLSMWCGSGIRCLFDHLIRDRDG